MSPEQLKAMLARFGGVDKIRAIMFDNSRAWYPQALSKLIEFDDVNEQVILKEVKTSGKKFISTIPYNCIQGLEFYLDEDITDAELDEHIKNQ